MVALTFEAPISYNSTLLLKYLSYIYYSMQFKKNQAKIQALLNSGSEVNIITPAYTTRLGFKI